MAGYSTLDFFGIDHSSVLRKVGSWYLYGAHFFLEIISSTNRSVALFVASFDY